MPRISSLLFALVLLLTAPSAALLAQEIGGWRFKQFQIENDDVFPIPYTEPSDRFYTNGMRVSFGKPGFGLETGPERLPRWARPIRRRCPQCTIHPSISFGQQLFTPEMIENPDPQPGERPWAAWLYGSYGATIDPSDRSRHDLEIQIGTTGSAAGGEAVQRLWHEIIGSPEPKGWDHQLDGELGFNTYYNYQYILLEADDSAVVDWDFVPSFKSAFGTVSSYAGIGGTVRIGRNITDFPYSPIQPSQMRSLPARMQNMEIYGFIGADIRAVVHNYFLEGSLFDDDPFTVDAKPWIWDFSFGITARYGSWNVTFAVVRRSEEFERTAGTDRGIHSFGSLSVTKGIRR